MTVSLCMIVRDEEAELPGCLESARGVADEVIVADTGSRDATRRLAQKAGARVFGCPWRGSFAQARNASVARATGDWIFWLDADERLQAPAAALRHALQNAASPLLPIAFLHYAGSAPDEYESWRFTDCRFFRRGLGIAFEGDIHEHLKLDTPALQAFGRSRGAPLLGAPLPGRILHTGYLDAEVAQKRKAQRNLPLIEAAMRGDYSPWLDYHRAEELFRLGDNAGALEAVNAALRHFLTEGKLPPAVCYRFKYNLLLLCGLPDETLRGLEDALRLYPDYVDLHYDRALLLMKLSRPAEAEEECRLCLALGERDRGYLSLTGCGSFGAAVLLGECARRQGKQDEAARAFARALEVRPGWPPALDGLRACTKNGAAPPPAGGSGGAGVSPGATEPSEGA